MGMSHIVERVNAGIKELDSRNDGWRDKVNVSTLDQFSHKNCVLGQIYGSYYVGTTLLALGDDAVVYYGFEAEDVADAKEYASLTSEWKRQLMGVATR